MESAKTFCASSRHSALLTRLLQCDTPPDADPVGTARASLPHDRTLLLHRSFLDIEMLPFIYPRR